MLSMTDDLSTGEENDILIVEFGFTSYTNGLLVAMSFIFIDDKVKETDGGRGVVLSSFLLQPKKMLIEHK